MINDIEECLDLDEDDDCTVKDMHNHLEEPCSGDWCDLLEIMKKRCRETNDGLREIFDDVCRPFPEITAHYSFESCSSILCRERQNYREKIPDSLAKLGMTLYENKIAKGYVSVGGKSAVIFTSSKLLEAFRRIERYIYGWYLRYVGTVIVLMENRTTEMYKEVFYWLKIHAKSIGTNNKLIIISDFEKATIKALRECFPLTKVHGCYFHYCQAVIKRWTKLRLDIPDQILSMVLTIPLLHADKFPEAE
ncbi:uncharacterized protein LOC103579047 isoform X1 [Microplitis demolitor]|uniref:uncharacterized protein LOC103579047 isoform X1 n=2 Tax=Microplitis demolitor TaxID=69319 RepID=UPI00235B5D52|nr:uncharacterized protein LOC103579047 isoform X1 [Microplitis demolitor]XP_053595153.1 uncharacterized protein LOC103579047 isoform X1 [Microplitis demolitor]XP_053595154.1 uncharacterized protein LOC103579047 isoform X1 [Microplitis demolitor]